VTIQVTKLDLFHGLQIVSIIDAHRRSGAITIHAPSVQQRKLGTTAGWQCCGAVYVLLLRISYLPAVREHLACWEAVYTWRMNSRAAVRRNLENPHAGYSGDRQCCSRRCCRRRRHCCCRGAAAAGTAAAVGVVPAAGVTGDIGHVSRDVTAKIWEHAEGRLSLPHMHC